MDQQFDGVKISINKDEERAAPSLSKNKTTVRKSEKKAENKKSKNPRRFGPMAIFLILIIAGFAVGGGVYFWQQKMSEESINKIEEQAKNARSDFEQRLNSLKDSLSGVQKENEDLKSTGEELKTAEDLLAKAKIDYESSDLGFSFAYPAILGQIDLAITGDDQGKKFKASFSKADKIYFSGVSKDYIAATSTASSTLAFLNTNGFTEKSGKYYFLPAGTSTTFALKPTSVINAKNTKVVTVNKKSFFYLPAGMSIDLGENIGAIVNLKNKTFSGLAFIDEDLGIMPLDDFAAMLKTIEVK